MRRFAPVFAFLALSVAAHAEDEPKGQFHRNISVKMLGYEPDRPVPELCEKKASTATIIRVSLFLKERPQEEQVKLHLSVAGFIGEARRVCDPPAEMPEYLPPFVKPGVKLSKAVCEAASDHLRDKIKKTIDDRVASDHPDPLTGFVYGVARALPPIVEACYDHVEPWSRLKTDEQLYSNQAKLLGDLRACTLWRRAFYDELKKAEEAAETKGRAAGSEYLKGKPMVALVGSRNYCTDEVGRAFEMSNYDLTRMVIEASPEKPAPKKN
jgi:hypothetical protein